MTDCLNPKSASHAIVERATLAERSSHWVRGWVRPAVVLVTGITLSVYGFRTMQEWHRCVGDQGAGGQSGSAGAPYIILLGGCILSLLSGVCCRPSAHRPSSPLTSMAGQTAKAFRTGHESLSLILNGASIPLFVIDSQHVVTHWNKACENLTGISAQDMVGTRKAWTAFYSVERPVMAELVVDQRPRDTIVALYGVECRESNTLPGAYEFESLFPNLGDGGKWLFFTAAPLRDAGGRVIGAIETFQDITIRKRVEGELQRRVGELSEAKRRMEVLVSNTTDREKRMVDLKSEVNELLQAMGRDQKYTVPRQAALMRARPPLSTVGVRD